MSADHYRDVLREVQRIVQDQDDSDEILRRVVDVLEERFDHYSWVGIYFVEGDELQLGPWNGPAATEHVRIPVGEGVCGAAAASGVTEIVVGRCQLRLGHRAHGRSLRRSPQWW